MWQMEQGEFPGMAMSPDAYAKQITFDVTRTRNRPKNKQPPQQQSHRDTVPLTANHVANKAVISLIVTCPPRGLPSYVIRGDVGNGKVR